MEPWRCVRLRRSVFQGAVQLRHLLLEAAQFIRHARFPLRPGCRPPATIQCRGDPHLCKPCFHTGPFLVPQGVELTIARENATARLAFSPTCSPLTVKRLASRSGAAWEPGRPAGKPGTCMGLSSQASTRRARNSITLTCVCVFRTTCAICATLMSSAYLSQSTSNWGSGKRRRANLHKFCRSSCRASNSAGSLTSASSGNGSSAPGGAPR